MPRQISLIVIHCSASPNGDSLFRVSPGAPGSRTPVQTIDGWHAQRGFKRSAAWRQKQNPGLASIGYHFVIYTGGTVATGRHVDEVGAHVQGFNQKSLGICMVGLDKFTPQQWASLRSLVSTLRKSYPDARLVGHRDLSPDQNKNGIIEPFEWLKTCPSFDVDAWINSEMTPPTVNLLGEVA